jgi:hypothetical protein
MAGAIGTSVTLASLHEGSGTGSAATYTSRSAVGVASGARGEPTATLSPSIERRQMLLILVSCLSF